MKKYFLGFLFLVLCLVPMGVLAEGEDTWICVGGNLYDVTSQGSKVDRDSITNEQLHNKTTLPKEYFNLKRRFGAGSAQIKEKFGDVNESDYAFETTSLNRKCNRRYDASGRYRWTSCPTTAQYNTNDAPYTTYKFQEAMSKFQFDGNGNFYVDVKDLFNSTLLIRAVRNGKPNKDDYDYASIRTLGWLGANETYELGSNGVRISFARGANVRLEFYINPNAGVDCAGAYVGAVDTVTPTYAEIPNPWKNSAICQSFQNGYSYIPSSPTNYKALLIPECYQDTIDYFTERNTITEASIRAKINEVNKMFQPSNDAELTQLQCHYHTDGSRETAGQTKTFIMNPASNNSSDSVVAGDYWAASCTETISINYDQPKKVVAGAGFPYDATLTVTRKCTPFVLRRVTQPEACVYGIECWGGPANHHGEGGAGPNEDFDSCVSTCDGGKYSKECVNKCYKKVYEGEEVNFATGAGRNFLDTIEARQIAVSCSTKTPTSPNYCYTSRGWSYINGHTAFGSAIYEIAASSNQQANCNGSTSCTSFHGHTFTYLNGCNSSTNPTMCYEVYRSNVRPKCSDNPDEDYYTLKAIAEREYEELLAAIRKYESTENFEMSVIDSYKTKDGKPLVTTNTSLSNMVKVTGGVYTYPDTKLTYKETPNVSHQVYSTVGDAKNVPQVEVTKEYKIELPQAVVDQVTGVEKYVPTTYRIPSNERNGGNKYYTDINAGTYNDFRKWTNNYSPLDERADAPNVGNNIGVVFKNIGTPQTASGKTSYTWDKINLDCFYGLLNKRYIECNDGICDIDCKDGDVCTGGIQYMFRQVDTSKVFPERSPRWNWTYTSERDQYGYASEPQKVIDEIQSKGDSVYSSENLDYNITITRENIRSIRRYNDQQKSYQNYDMDCSSQGNGMDVCESKMLKNTSYVNTYQRNTEIGSNN